MTTEELDKTIKLTRQELVTEFFEKQGIDCEWQGILRMVLNGLHFTWHTDFSGINFDAFRTLTPFPEDLGIGTDKETIIKLEKLFNRQNLNDFDNLAKLIK